MYACALKLTLAEDYLNIKKVLSFHRIQPLPSLPPPLPQKVSEYKVTVSSVHICFVDNPSNQIPLFSTKVKDCIDCRQSIKYLSFFHFSSRLTPG